jgi:hypothetical protein
MSWPNGVKHLRYTDGGVSTPEMEYWLIEHERTHRPEKRGSDSSYTTPELFHKSQGSSTVLELMVGNRTHRSPGFGRQIPSALNDYLLPPGAQHPAFGLAPPNPEGLYSLPPRADLSIELSRGNYGRSKPTELGGELPSHGGLPRLRRNIGAGLTAFFQKQEEDFEASIDRVRARCPDHCIDNSVVFILQDPELDIGKFLPNMGETRMLAGHYQFKLSAGRIKKFKAKKRKEKRRELKV